MENTQTAGVAPGAGVRLPPVTRAWVLSDGKVGDEAQCFGVAEALGLQAERRLVRPRRHFALLAPFAPIDPREAPARPGSPLAPPFPDLAIAAGRRTVPYLRHLKRASGGRVFTVFVKDPYVGSGAADVIWVPQHDRLRAENVIATVTPAHRMRPERLAAARTEPDPRVAAVRPRRVAVLLGGPSVHHRFADADVENLVALAAGLAQGGCGLMVTPSRRTPPDLTTALRAALDPIAHFVWDGTGANPYVSILALAEALVVTGDSVNMLAEAVATGMPVHVYEPTGGHPKITTYIDRLVMEGAVRRWRGALEHWRYTPIDATGVIAAEVGRRYLHRRVF